MYKALIGFFIATIFMFCAASSLLLARAFAADNQPIWKNSPTYEITEQNKTAAISRVFESLKNIGEGTNNGAAGEVALREACKVISHLGDSELQNLWSSAGFSELASSVSIRGVCASLVAGQSPTGMGEGMTNAGASVLAAQAVSLARATSLPWLSKLEVEGGLVGDSTQFSVTSIQPVWSNPEAGIFAMNQISWYRTTTDTDDGDADDTLNTGIAVRKLANDDTLMLGGNVFFDHQLDQNHNRLSLGGEIHSSLYGLSANRYIPLTQWKKVDELNQARARAGWDAEISGRLPDYPAWTTYARAFQWDSYEGEKDIYGSDINLEWSPVPAFVIAGGVIKDNDNTSDVNLGMRLRFNIGEPWEDQLKPREKLDSVTDRVWDKVRRENTIRTQMRKNPSFVMRVIETLGNNTAISDEGNRPLYVGMRISMPATLSVENAPGSIARFEMVDGGILRLGQATQVQVEPGLMTLVTGVMQYISGATDVTVNVPGGTITLLGTDIDVVSDGATSSVFIRDGSIAIDVENGGNLSGSAGDVVVIAGGASAVMDDSNFAYQDHITTTNALLDRVGEAVQDQGAAPYVIDAPYVSSLPALAGDPLVFAVNYSQSVTVTGSPTLGLIINSENRTAVYSGVLGGQTLLFTYQPMVADDGATSATSTGINIPIGDGITAGAKQASPFLLHDTVNFNSPLLGPASVMPFTVSWDADPVNAAGESSASFTLASPDTGGTYEYTITSSGGGAPVTGTGMISSNPLVISGLDLSGLGNGTVTLSLTVTSTTMITSAPEIDTVSKDASAPIGYAALWTTSPVLAADIMAAAFDITDPEIGADYSYSITSSGGGAAVTGSGTVSAVTESVSGIDVSGLENGTLTVSVTLTDTAGNAGAAVIDTTVLNKNILTIDGAPVTVGVIDFAYAGFTVVADNGTAPYTYSIHQGTLPNGISLDGASGVISGTPTQSGTFSNIVIRATDNDNLTADLAPFTLVISESLAAAVSTPASNPTAANPIAFTIVFSEAVTGFILSDISVTNGTAGNLQTSDNITWTVDVTPSMDGDVSLSLAANVAQGTLGNGNTGSNIETVVSDLSPPAAPVIVSVTPDTGLAADGITNAPSVMLSGTAEANATVEVFIDSASIGTAIADGSGNWSFDHTSVTLADAVYAVTAAATDAVGNTGADSTTFTLTIDTTPPTITSVVQGP